MEKIEKYIDIQLIDKSFDKSETLTTQETKELASWLDASDEHRKYYNRARNAYKNRFRNPLSQREMDKRLRELNNLIRQSDNQYKIKNIRVRRMRAAAIATISAAASITLILNILLPSRISVEYADTIIEQRNNMAMITVAGQQPVSTEKLVSITIPKSGRIVRGEDNVLNYTGIHTSHPCVMNTVSVPHGAEYNVILNDGTSVRLNAESTITFPVCFDGETREITITGEACINVAHNPKKPFITHIDHTDITVCGTTFIASCYHDGVVETSLLEGRVTVLNTLNGNEISLTPGQSAISHSNGGMEVADKIDSSTTAWLNREFCFENERIENIINTLSKWYTINNVAYRGEGVKEMRFSGSFSRDMNLKTVLELISMVSDISFNVKENNIEVNKK